MQPRVLAAWAILEATVSWPLEVTLRLGTPSHKGCFRWPSDKSNIPGKIGYGQFTHYSGWFTHRQPLVVTRNLWYGRLTHHLSDLPANTCWPLFGFYGLTMIGAMELQPDDGPRSSLSIGSRFGRYSGISLEFARRFIEGIRKLVGNMSGDHRKKTIELIARMQEATGLAGVFKPPILRNLGTFGG
ncbi:hypothetical protein BHM03_00033385 [Ensete ventricosum]|uniref:Uncharacterized protein n=1 Tax=Ensete ventricosum TaxID=4639 RepID=A0A445MIU0_ENSVE|nr:hypothetical protein BHM03_00033385 [Ensete ventricosum]